MDSVEIEITLVVGIEGSISGTTYYTKGKKNKVDISIFADDIPDDEYDKAGYKIVTVKTTVPVAKLFKNHVIEGVVETGG